MRMKKIRNILLGVIIALGLIYIWIIQPLQEGNALWLAFLIAVVVIAIVSLLTKHKEKGEK